MLYGFFPPPARAIFVDAYHAAGGPALDSGTLARARVIAATTIVNLAAYAINIGHREIIAEIEASARWIAED